MDTVSEQRLSEVHPKLANLIRMMAHQLELESIPIRVIQGLRTWEEQDALYAQGRTSPGNIVTNTPGGYSWHCFGLSADVVPMDKLTQLPDWNVSHSSWQRIISLGENLGLVSGSNWRTFKDYPHFQLTGIFAVNPSNHVRDVFKRGGIPAVWSEAFPITQTPNEAEETDAT